jgi:hypothetical protein
MDSDRFDALIRGLSMTGPRRSVLRGLARAVLVGSMALPRFTVSADGVARSTTTTRHKKQAGGPVELCSDLGARCAFSGDCCDEGTRCKRVGDHRECRCQAGWVGCQAANRNICCPPGEVCCFGRCSNLQTDIVNCVACLATCNLGETCVAGICKP